MPYDKVSSLPAYNENKSGKDYCRSLVLLTIKKLVVCNDRELAEYLNWSINRITPRRGELVASGLIIPFGKFEDEKTGRTVSYWKENKGQPVQAQMFR